MKTVEPDSADSLVFECDFDEPPEKVWRALTEPELLQAWLTKDASRESDSTDCEIVSAEPHRRLRYRWRDRETVTGDTEPREVDSFVTVELSAARAGGTHLRLTQPASWCTSPPVDFRGLHPISSGMPRTSCGPSAGSTSSTRSTVAVPAKRWSVHWTGTTS